MLNIILGFAILVLMIITPIATLVIMGEIFALIVTKMHKNIEPLSKICSIIVICDIILKRINLMIVGWML